MLFDGAMLLANFYLLESINSRPIEAYTERQIGILLGAAALAQFLGALLKKRPLQQRLRAAQTDGEGKLIGCLAFIHFIFFLIVVAMALAFWGFIDLNQSSSLREYVWVGVAMALAGIISGTVWLAAYGSPPVDEPGGWFRYQEITANILLWISAFILTRFFWTALLFESEPPSYMGFSSRAFVYIAATSLLFMVFYVPARLLFLIEDYFYPLTWLRLWLVAMLPLIIIVFFGGS